MPRRLSLPDTLESFRASCRANYTEALTAISLDMEEVCREPEPDAHETAYEVPFGLDPVRLASKATRRLSKPDISQGLRVQCGYDTARDEVVCKISPRAVKTA
ncbi:hypothetical protein BDK51DRAFT_32031 [Blyttiomyces helicus]|uniref:Uncharacterized protein n=1 Tax=Blyttiomyces helicus TaxID=388810 RepID=A0A4P9W2I5_9FUNG|nr:hypothetical protein BDK51DRAFT_32031 [Blyttiomyces helicus]|eukprot:RKO85952.1 hypothetical protein BDK51DRAFT_32031 [Blyttiomyces helicus]